MNAHSQSEARQALSRSHEPSAIALVHRDHDPPERRVVARRPPGAVALVTARSRARREPARRGCRARANAAVACRPRPRCARAAARRSASRSSTARRRSAAVASHILRGDPVRRARRRAPRASPNSSIGSSSSLVLTKSRMSSVPVIEISNLQTCFNGYVTAMILTQVIGSEEREIEMHPEFSPDEDSRARSGSSKSGSERRSCGRQVPEARPAEPEVVVLRLCSVHDDEALERLAALEGLPVAGRPARRGRGRRRRSSPRCRSRVACAGRSVPRDGAPAAAARAAREAAHAGAPQRARARAVEHSSRLEPRLAASVGRDRANAATATIAHPAA